MSDYGWSDDRVDRLTRLWQDGLSASQIAKQLGGVTRNAVIGKVHRLGLSGRAEPSRPTRTVVRAPRPARTRSPAPCRPPRMPEPSPTEPVHLAPPEQDAPGLATPVTLGAHMCKWPIGDPLAEDFAFCGRRTDNKPYCALHDRRAHRPGKPQPLDRDPTVRRALAGFLA